MRLWSINPSYLDSKGLVALWREGLLARKVLRGETRGYTRHPQLERFRLAEHPAIAIDHYLKEVAIEATARGYSFDSSKIDMGAKHSKLVVTTDQLAFERTHLSSKLSVRDTARNTILPATLAPHPLFEERAGVIESWERP